jgi:Winged helix DNA-binding domain
MAYGIRYMVPLVFTPPRGVWGGRGQVTLTTLEAWLGRPPGPAFSDERLVKRYLAAFGPASAADMRAWSGLAMRSVFERLRPGLKVFRDEKGVELLDLPRAPRPSGDTHAPVRLIPDFDNVLLAHADRTRVMPPGKHLGIFSSNGVMQGAVLLDGFVRGMWRPAGDSIVITPFGKPIPKPEQPAIVEEAMRLAEFLEPGDKKEVRFGPVKD